MERCCQEHGVSYYRRRRGAVYLFVLTTGMLVTVIAMAVLFASQINGRMVAQNNDSIEAQALAQSALEFGLNAIAGDSNWRNDYPANMPVGPTFLGRGTIGFSIVDDAGGILADPNDSVRVYGIGKVNNACRVYSVHCSVSSSPLTCLQAVEASAGGGNFGTSTTFTGSGTLSSNGTISGTLNAFNALNLQAGLGILSLLSSGTGTRNGLLLPTLTFPDSTHVFDYYKAAGTNLSIGSLPVLSNVSQLWYRVLGPNFNTMGGGSSANGIYILDCKGGNVSIKNCRIVGTLVLLNAGPSCAVQGSNYFQTGANGFPVLMVQGNFSIGTSTTALADTSSTGYAGVSSINYNQTLPYLNVTDSTYTTTYPSRFEGLVYVSGNVTIPNLASPTITGALIVGGSLTASSGAAFNYNSAFLASPPPGFTSNSAIAPAGGTWQWEAAQ
ncbi:MAG TPA: hypothetical protein VFC78_03960 [Tepidisphaeraceae bacterium]|nr:hypothetical protein [Tepidisphaeraceae bacterium]